MAPHCRVAGELVRLLDEAKDPNTDYNQLVFGLLDATLSATLSQNDSKLAIDPLVQCEFIEQILVFAKKTSPALETFAEEHHAKLITLVLLEPDWTAICRDTEIGKRLEARIYLSELAEKTGEEKNRLGKSNKKLNLARLKSWCEVVDYDLVGFVCRDKGKWILQAKITEKLNSQTDLYVIVPGLNNSATRFVFTEQSSSLYESLQWLNRFWLLIGIVVIVWMVLALVAAISAYWMGVQLQGFNFD